MGALAADVRLVIVLLTAGMLARIVMLWWQRGTFAPATGWGDIGESALSGLRLDMQVASAMAAASAALGLVHLIRKSEPVWLENVRRRLRAGILLVVVAILPLLTAIDLAYLGEYGRRFDSTLFSASNDDVGAIARTIWHNWPVLPILALTLPLGIGLAWLGLRFGRPRCEAPVWLDRQPLGSRVAITLVVGAMAVLFARGSLGRTPWNMSVAYLGTDPRLDQLVPSTLKALHRAWIDHRHITRSDGFQAFIPDGDVRAAAARWAGHDAADLDALTARAAAGGRPAPPRHVLLVVLESYGAWALADAWRPLGLTEGMRELGAEGALLTRFTSGADFTMKSFGSVVAGLPYAGLELPYLPASHTPFPTSLPAAFKRLGYRTRFFYAGYASWQQIDAFVRDQGFDESSCGGTLGLDPRRHNEWGLPDTAFFPAVLDRLDDSAPTLTVVLSVGNHEPFDVDVHAAGFPLHTPPPAMAARCDEAFDAKVLGHFWLMDRAFTRFIRAAGERLPHLLVAATGDHFGRRFPNRRPDLAERTLVPLLLWGPGLDRPLPPDQAGSHLDIAPTLIERCAPAGFAYHSFGRDLLAPVSGARGIGYTAVVTPEAVMDLAGPEQDGCTAAAAAAWRRLANDERTLGWWRARNGAAWPATLKTKGSSRRRRTKRSQEGPAGRFRDGLARRPAAGAAVGTGFADTSAFHRRGDHRVPSRLAVGCAPSAGQPAARRAGHALTVVAMRRVGTAPAGTHPWRRRAARACQPRHTLCTLAEAATALPRVRPLGFRNDIPDLLAAADAFTLISHLEGLGMAAMDAMCCGLPVVATQAGVVPELIADGKDGLLVPVGDTTAVADALGRLLNDAGLRSRLGTAARATATRRFLASEMVTFYIELHNRVTRDA